MNVSRELLMDWGVPIAATVAFIVATGIVGFMYDSSGLSATGGIALVGVIVAFVLGMALIGFLTAEPED